MEEAATIALSTVYAYLMETKADMTVYHVCFNKQTEKLYRTILSNRAMQDNQKMVGGYSHGNTGTWRK